MSMIKCPECGQPVSTNAGTCPHCGIAVSGHLFKCPECGAYNLDNMDTCVVCGKELVMTKPETENKHTPVAAEAEPPSQPQRQPEPAKKKKKKNNHTPWILSILLIAGMAVGAFLYYTHGEQQVREEKDFKLLEDATNPEYFQEFLINYPNSIHYAEVQERMRALRAENGEWLLVLQDGKREAFEEFMLNHPNTVHSRECHDKLDSLDWQNAKSSETEEAVQKYLIEHPDGKYTEEATELNKKLIETTVSPEEKDLITGIIDNFCNALARRDATLMQPLMGESMTLFNDKANATIEDVLQFSASKFVNDVIGVHYLVGSALELSKEKITDETYGYVVDFQLEETINRSDATQQSNKSYKAHAVLNTEKKIISMNISTIAGSVERL